MDRVRTIRRRRFRSFGVVTIPLLALIHSHSHSLIRGFSFERASRFGGRPRHMRRRPDGTDERLPSARAPPPEREPIDGFKLIRSLTLRTTHSSTHESIFATALLAFTASATVAATAVAYGRSRTKAERDLPAGTHWRAARLGGKALGYATLACGAGAGCAWYVASSACGAKNAEDWGRVLRRGTKSALEVASPGFVESSEKSRRR